MDKVYEAFLELNKQMLMQNMSGDFEVILSPENFDKLGFYLAEKNRSVHWHYEGQPVGIAKSAWFRVAGPGGYITFRRLSK